MKLITNTTTDIPATLFERAKDHLRLTTDADGDQVLFYLDTAIDDAETFTGRAIFTKTMTHYLGAFPSSDEIVLPRSPLASVQSVKYYDTDGVIQTVSASDYTVNIADNQRGTITLNDTAEWPDVDDDDAEAVEIAFTVGYGDDINDAPPMLIAGVVMYAGHLFDNRTAADFKDNDMIRDRLFNRYKARWY